MVNKKNLSRVIHQEAKNPVAQAGKPGLPESCPQVGWYGLALKQVHCHLFPLEEALHLQRDDDIAVT